MGVRKRCQILSKQAAAATVIFLSVVLATAQLVCNIFCPYCTLTLIFSSSFFLGEQTGDDQKNQGVWGSAEALPNFEQANCCNFSEHCFGNCSARLQYFLPIFSSLFLGEQTGDEKKMRGFGEVRKRCQILSEQAVAIFLSIVLAIAQLVYNIFCPYRIVFFFGNSRARHKDFRTIDEQG